MQWANFLMKRRFFIEASRDLMPAAPKGVDRLQIKRMTLEILEKQDSVEGRSQARASISEEVIQCIEEDDEGLFQSTHIEQKPAANFRYIALRFLSGYSWKEISEELGVKVVTLLGNGNVFFSQNDQIGKTVSWIFGLQDRDLDLTLARMH
jgi:hypothetical protein